MTYPASVALEITGRDHYLINKALAYAVATIGSLPDHLREVSDACDMCALLASRTSNHGTLLYEMNYARQSLALPVLPPTTSMSEVIGQFD